MLTFDLVPATFFVLSGASATSGSTVTLTKGRKTLAVVQVAAGGTPW